jgi:hypothetical protein
MFDLRRKSNLSFPNVRRNPNDFLRTEKNNLDFFYKIDDDNIFILEN